MKLGSTVTAGRELHHEAARAGEGAGAEVRRFARSRDEGVAAGVGRHAVEKEFGAELERAAREHLPARRGDTINVAVVGVVDIARAVDAELAVGDVDVGIDGIEGRRPEERAVRAGELGHIAESPALGRSADRTRR